MSDHSNFRVVNEDGEFVGTLDTFTQPLEDVINGLQRDIRGWSARYEELKRDKAVQARNHPLYSDVETVFKEWKRKCRHPRSPFTAERFWLAVPYFENPKYGMRVAMKAIDGAAYDPFEPTRKNGTKKRLDEWSRIFKDADTFEEFVNKAPREQMALTT